MEYGKRNSLLLDSEPKAYVDEHNLVYEEPKYGE